MVSESIVALVTPFKVDKQINYEKLEELIEYHISVGTDGIVVAGTTGEASTLTFEEKVNLYKETVRIANNRIKVIAGTGSNDTETAIRLSKKAEEAGVDQVLVVTPYYNKANEEGLYLHYKAIAESISIPVILYNVPSRTGMDISLHNVKRLSHIKNIIGIKEANPELTRFTKIRKFCPNFLIYTGNDNNILETLELGSNGVISVFGNVFPKELKRIVINEDRALFNRYLHFIETLFVEVNPIPVKEAMNLKGLEVGTYRLPLFNISTKNKEKLIKSLWEVL